VKHTCESVGRSGCEPCRRLEFDLWEAINRYAISVGGDPSRHSHGNTPRMQAVVDVDALVARVRSQEPIEAATPCRHLRAVMTEAGLLCGTCRERLGP
jgi:hypothetical protein